MARVTPEDVQVWLEPTKLRIETQDDIDPLAGSVESLVLGRLDSQFDVSTWIDEASTPAAVKTVIAMHTAAWYYNSVYSESGDGGNTYADKLMQMADQYLDRMLDGTLVIEEATDGPGISGLLSYYPTDAEDETDPRAFAMGDVF